MTYAVVHDVPASWEHYQPLGAALANPVPNGLLLHVAGPTDEGFRVIDIWASREDWEQFRTRRDDDVAALAPTTLRELNGIATILGERA